MSSSLSSSCAVAARPSPAGNARASSPWCCLQAKDDAAERAPSLTYQPHARRRCTDAGCLLLYALSWAGFVAIIVAARAQGGDPQRIVHGVDFRGDVCGSGALQGRPYAAFVAMPSALSQLDPLTAQLDCADCYQIRTCVADCAATQYDPYVLDPYVSENLLYTCVPVPGASVGAFSSFSSSSSSSSSFSGNASAGAAAGFSYADPLGSLSATTAQAYADLAAAWPVLLGSVGIALAASYAYLWLASRWAYALIGFGVLVLAGGGACLSYVLLGAGAQAAASVSAQRQVAMQVLGALSALGVFLLLAAVFALRHRLAVAVELVRESVRSVRYMKWVMAFPLAVLALGLGYLALFVAGVLWISSAWTAQTRAPLPAYVAARLAQLQQQGGGSSSPGDAAQQAAWSDLSAHDAYYYYTYNTHLQAAFAYLLLHLLWTCNALAYFVYLVVSAATARHYFLPRDRATRKKKGVPLFPLRDAVWLVLRHHLGTVLLGASLVAFLEFLRLLARYFAKLRCLRGGDNPNCAQALLGRLMLGCAFVSRCCLDAVSKGALIWTGLYGDAFCMSCKCVFTLLFHNPLRLAVLWLVTSYLTWLGRLMVAAATAGFGGLVLYRYYAASLSSLALPCALLLVVGYLVSALVLNTIETCVDTVFVSFLVDEQVHGATGQMLAGERLKKVLYKQAASAQSAYERAAVQLRQQQQQQKRAVAAAQV